MQYLERLGRTLGVAFAALLLGVVVTLSALTVAKGVSSGRIGTLQTATKMAAQTGSESAGTTAVGATQNQTVTSASLVAAGVTQQATTPQQQSGIVDARSTVKADGPAVVTIINTMQVTTGRGRYRSTGQTGEAYGSGVIISNQGYIVTNQHVVADEQNLQVIFADGTKVPAKLIGSDANVDIAVIKVDTKVPAVAQFGDSSTLEVGQPVIAIGSALGDYVNTVTEGVISGLHRSILDPSTGAVASQSLQDLVQTDAAINHGNSGGPLIDIATGKIVGIDTAVVRTTGVGYSAEVAEGLGFSVPSNTAKSVADRLMKNAGVSQP